MKLKAKIFKRLGKNNSNIINLKWPSQYQFFSKEKKSQKISVLP